MEGTLTRSPHSEEGKEAVELYNDVNLMHEMHWSYDELMATPEDVVWATVKILSLQADKHERELKRASRGR